MSLKTIKIEGLISTAKFINRPNRFLVNIIIDGEKEPEKAFLHDPGRMKELLHPNASLIVRKPLNTNERKTKWDVLGVKLKENKIVVINSSLPNIVAKVALINNWIDELDGFKLVRPEITVNKSRLDFLLEKNDYKCFVEVKGVTLVEDSKALFPDAPTDRGRRHLKELITLKKEGNRSIILFICMRNDPVIFSPNWVTDLKFSEQLKLAQEEEVEILVYKVYPYIEDSYLKLHFQNKIKVEILPHL